MTDPGSSELPPGYRWAMSTDSHQEQLVHDVCGAEVGSFGEAANWEGIGSAISGHEKICEGDPKASEPIKMLRELSNS